MSVQIRPMTIREYDAVIALWRARGSRSSLKDAIASMPSHANCKHQDT
jgi:hypothetical protein